MLNDNIRPSTLEGVKRLATQIKKKHGLKHFNALELAAQAAGCSNFRHALRTLPSSSGPLSRLTVLLTVYWYDKKNFQRGRETLKVDLSKPILEICSKADFKRVRGFRALRMVAADHFVSDVLAQSQGSARRMICMAERSLRFMEHTGLRPWRYRQTASTYHSVESSLPNTDHTTRWVDPSNGQFILVDEPYSNKPDDDTRKAWASQHHWKINKSAWPGMYFPHRCDLYVATDGTRNYDFETLTAKINAIPAPITDETWTGDSVPSHEVFFSPAAKTPQDRRRARSKGTVTPVPSAKTVPYSSMLGHSERRPAGAMTIAEHIEAGRIIKAVIHSSSRPYGVFTRMDSLRSTMEDWLAFEIGPGQLEGPEFFDVYYHDPDSEGPYAAAAQSKSGLIHILGELKQKLRDAYPDCAPLRKQLHCIEMSMKLISKMSTKAHR